MASKQLTLLVVAALVLGAAPAYAHNQKTSPDCPVQVLKQATAKPDIYISLDASGSMEACPNGNWSCSFPNRKIDIAIDVIKTIVNDPVVGGKAVNYGYQEWSSPRTGSCTVKRFVNLPVCPTCDADNSAAVSASVSGAAPGGGTPQAAALVEAKNYYPSVIAKDTVLCRKRYVLMITDGEWNCTGDPCPVATQLGAIGVKVIAVGFGSGVGYSDVVCMANNSGGVAAKAENKAELLQKLKDLIGQTLSGNVVASPSIVGTVIDPTNAAQKGLKGNYNIVAPVDLPTFRGHFKAYSMFKKDPADPTGTKLIDDVDANGNFIVKWDAGDDAHVTAISWANRDNIFTANKWATCFKDQANVSMTPTCNQSVSGPGPYTRVTFNKASNPPAPMPAKWKDSLLTPDDNSAGLLIDFIRGRDVIYVPSSPTPYQVNPKPKYPNGDKEFKIWATLSMGGSIEIPPMANITASTACDPPNSCKTPYADDYATFRDYNKNRETVYYIQTDSGGVHAFSTQTLNGNVAGREKWMFIPRENLSRLKNLLVRGQAIDVYTYLGQGRTVVFDYFDQPTKAGGGGRGWMTMLVAGFGAAGRAYYGLDVTDPTVKPDILWAFTDDDNHSGGEPSKAVLVDSFTSGGKSSDFGTMGLALSAPALSDEAKMSIVVGSGPANSYLSQPQDYTVDPKRCVGIPLDSEYGVGHWLYNINPSTGALVAGMDVRKLGSGDPNDIYHDLFRSQINAVDRLTSSGDTEIDVDINNPSDISAYVAGGSLGHLVQWDGGSKLVHLTSARTGAESDSVLPDRPITMMPLVFHPSLVDQNNQVAPCKINNVPITTAAYFGTGDDTTAGPVNTKKQYIFAVDLSAGPYPTYKQIPGSPYANLALRERVVTEPKLVRVQRKSPATGWDNAVLFVTFLGASNACGSGVSTLYTFNACNPAIGGWDANGNGSADAGDRSIALGQGRAESMDTSGGKLIITGSNQFKDFNPCGTSTADCVAEAVEPPTTNLWNWKIKD